MEDLVTIQKRKKGKNKIAAVLVGFRVGGLSK